jgi:formyltetrahydrofolate hydrolase
MSFVQTSTTVKTVKQNIQITNFNANHIKEQIMKEIRQTNISSEITGFIFNHKQLRPGKYEINYIYELVSKEIIKSKRIALASADFI